MSAPTRCRIHVVVIATLLLAVAHLCGQAPSSQVFEVPRLLGSGVHANSTGVERMVWQQLVEVKYVHWLKLRFRQAELPGTSRVEIKSCRDGHTQALDAAAMRQWFPHSAYFNGDALIVRLFAGPYTERVEIEIEAVEVGLPPYQEDSICGSVDDRVLSNDPRCGRLMPAGCTGWIGTRHGLIFTAGHCPAKSVQLIEFNVPLSNTNGSKNHPPPQDQFPLIRILGGLANANACDWAIYTPGQNTLQQTPLQRQGGYFKLAAKMPAINSTLRITGYGMHLQKLTWSQAQKTVTGPFVGMGQGTCGPYLTRYLVDSISGDSGAPVIDEATGAVVAVHSGGDCAGTIGANQGSAIINPDIQRILQNPNPPPAGPITRGDLMLSHSGPQLGSRIVQIDRNSGSMATFAWGGASLAGLTMDANNVDFAVLDRGVQDYLLQISPTGAVATIAALGAIQTPTALELDQDGSWLVSSTDNHIRRVTPAGAVTTVVSLPVAIFERTNDIARDHDTGYLVAGVWDTGELFEIDVVQGRIVRTITTSTASFYGVDIEPRTGNYVVVSYTSPEVRVYDRKGTLVRSWSFPYLLAVEIDDQTGHYYLTGFGHVAEFRPDGTKVNHHGPYASLSFNAVDKYGSKQVVGRGSALPGSTYQVAFLFHGMPLASYAAALSFAQRPGIAFANGVLNLAADKLFEASLNGALVHGFSGTLDAQGRGSGRIAIPSFVPPGLTFFCSAVALAGGRVQLGNTIGITVR